MYTFELQNKELVSSILLSVVNATTLVHEIEQSTDLSSLKYVKYKFYEIY